MSPIATKPLHPSVASRLDPGYVEFYNSTIQYFPPLTTSWNPAIREAEDEHENRAPLDVAKVQDFDLTHAKIRTFTPHGPVPEGGWPVFIFMHGGGWTLGNIRIGTSFSSHVAEGARCVVASVHYRLAPENPYPAALVDVIEAFDWVLQNGSSSLHINTSRIAVGGFSAGGNLAAVLALKAAERNPPVPLVFQLLLCPVMDNTASVDNLWAENAHAPQLTPETMLWFRKNYLPTSDLWTNWDASPVFAPKELLAKVPKTYISVSEIDVLRNEGLLYGKLLKEQGVEVETKVFERAPHTGFLMDKLVPAGALLFSDAVQAVAKAFNS